MASPFVFKSPEEQRVHELLRLVGEGPTAYFRDACRIMAGAEKLESASHLVGHLLREVESALRGFALALADAQERAPTPTSSAGWAWLAAIKRLFRRAGTGRGEGQMRWEVERCVRVLNVPGGKALAATWTELELHEAAHRRGREAPRLLDDNAHRRWRDFLRVAGAVLERVTELYGHYLVAADELLAIARPTKADAKRLQDRFPRNLAFRSYFYGKLENAAWLPMLLGRRLLARPPEPTLSADGTLVTQAHWPEAGYVARVAADRRNSAHVCAFLAQAEHGDDALAVFDLAESVLRLPLESAVTQCERSIEWARLAHRWSPLAGRLIEYAARLVTGGHADEGLRVARAAMALREDPRPSDRGMRDPQGSTSAWEYRRLLEEFGEAAGAHVGVRWLGQVADLLDEAIRLSLPVAPGDGDLHVWESQLLHEARRDDDERDHPPRNARDALLAEVRRSARALIGRDPSQLGAVVGVLDSRSRALLRLVLLEVLAQPELARSDLSKSFALHRELLQNHDLEPEYRTLLWAAAPHMTHEEIARVIRLVDEGPDWARAQLAEGEHAEDLDAEALFAGRMKRWQRDVLGGMRTALDAASRARLDALEAEHGRARPAYPDFGIELLRASPESPIQLEEARTWSPEQLLEFVRTWTPTTKDPWRGGESPRDLSDVIAKVVAGRPAEFSSRAREWTGVQKTYARGFLEGLQEAAKAQVALDWAAALALARWVVDQPRTTRTPTSSSDFFEDPDWGWARSTLLRLLDAGLTAKANGIPVSMRKEVWALIDACLSDPDPEAGDDPERDYEMDVATMSINRRRACALHSAVRYAMWSLGAAVASPPPNCLGSVLPEVREALDRHLDPGRERSRAVRAVYGWRLRTLWHLDREWAADAIPRMFPRSPEDASLRAAAWETFLIWGGQPPAEFASLLSAEYATSIRDIGASGQVKSRREDPRHGLVHHVLQYYAHGDVGLDTPDGLVRALFAAAPDEFRAEAARFLGHGLSEKEECPPAVRDRLMALWEWRVTETRSSTADSRLELAAFGSWLRARCVPGPWLMRQAVTVVRAVGRLDPSWHVVESLGALLPESPVEVLECLQRMVEGSQGTWEMSGWEEEGTKILRAALAHERPDVRSRARDVVNRLLALGYSSLRSLLGDAPPTGGA